MADIQEGTDRMLVYAGMHAGFVTVAGTHIYARNERTGMRTQCSFEYLYTGWVSLIVDVYE